MDSACHVKVNGTWAGFGCGLVVGVPTVRVSGTIESDLPEYGSTPECPSNLDCALTFDTDTDPDECRCGETTCHVIEKHGDD